MKRTLFTLLILAAAYLIVAFAMIGYRTYQANHYNKTHEQVTRLK